MKHRVRVLLSTISAAVMAAIFGAPTSAGARASDVDQPPIERLSSIRNAYLSTLKSDQLKAEAPSGEDQTAQFRNFPNFPNFSNWRNR
jgi:hypothetical protein